MRISTAGKLPEIAKHARAGLLCSASVSLAFFCGVYENRKEPAGRRRYEQLPAGNRGGWRNLAEHVRRA